MSSKFTDMISRVKEVQEIQPGKFADLEENDFKALLIAAAQVFGPILLGMLGFFAILIFILTILWR